MGKWLLVSLCTQGATLSAGHSTCPTCTYQYLTCGTWRAPAHYAQTVFHDRRLAARATAVNQRRASALLLPPGDSGGGLLRRTTIGDPALGHSGHAHGDPHDPSTLLHATQLDSFTVDALGRQGSGLRLAGGADLVASGLMGQDVLGGLEVPLACGGMRGMVGIGGGEGEPLGSREVESFRLGPMPMMGAFGSTISAARGSSASPLTGMRMSAADGIGSGIWIMHTGQQAGVVEQGLGAEGSLGAHGSVAGGRAGGGGFRASAAGAGGGGMGAGEESGLGVGLGGDVDDDGLAMIAPQRLLLVDGALQVRGVSSSGVQDDQ